MLINPIAREIVIDGDDGVEHAASPSFLPYSSHVTYFQSPGIYNLKRMHVLMAGKLAKTS
jgi:hypothetical protein